MPDFPPSLFDRADGSAGIGTSTPPDAVQRRPGGIFFEEEPTSPSIERAEQATIVHEYNCDEDTGLTLIQGIGRGYIQTDDDGNQTRVLSALLNRKKGDVYKLTITSEGLSFDVPPDEFNVQPQNNDLAIEKHPFFKKTETGADGLYTYNVDPDTLEPNNATLYTGPQIIALVKNSLQASSIAGASEMDGLWKDDSHVDDLNVQDQADFLLTLLKKGIETFYFAGWRVTWSQYFWLPQLMDGGGYVQDPVDGGLPAYFWSDDKTESGNNIFDRLAAATNPDIYGDGISWLREADVQEYARTWFRLTRTWIGAPFGHWESPVPYPKDFLHA